VSTKQLLPSLQFENEVHKTRVKMQQEHIEKLESRIQYYIEQQSYLSLVRIDLQKYKHAYDKSLKDGTAYSPFTPSK